MSVDAPAAPADVPIDPRVWKTCRSPAPGAFTLAFAALVGLQAIVLAATLRLPLRINPHGAVARP